MSIHLRSYGLSDRFEREASVYPELYLARVTEQHKNLYRLVSRESELTGAVSGRLQHGADGGADFPAVGDWVMIDRQGAAGGDAVIHRVLSRKSAFVRKSAGTANERQVVAANIDTLFLCMSLNADFNPRRMERYLTIAWDSRAVPVIVLTKSDLCDDLEERLGKISAVAPGVDTAVCSAENSGGLDAVRKYILPGQTVAFIGSSGVGKSTLINRLAGKELLATKEIREDDDKGRHTTTHRQLILLQGGGIVIDTPGMRELALYTGDVSKSFEDIEELARRCKYSDCSHTSEPCCAVRQAIESGELSEKRFENYLKLSRELAYSGLDSRQLENEKINRMFGSKAEMKQAFKQIKGRKA
jgi:ribosome biogenesis GTPase